MLRVEKDNLSPLEPPSPEQTRRICINICDLASRPPKCSPEPKGVRGSGPARCGEACPAFARI